MANTTTLQLYNAIFTALSTDATLKSYIKQFSRKLALAQAHVSFPVILFGLENEGITPLTVGLPGGRDQYEYIFSITVFIRSFADDFVIEGSATEKGMLAIIEDILNVVSYKRFGEIILYPSRVENITYVAPSVGDNFTLGAGIELKCTDLRYRAG
jgi:hypothetical protein